MNKGPLWEMERGGGERIRCSRVRGMRKTQKAGRVFPRGGGRGTDEKSTGRINSKMNHLVKVKVLNEVRYQCSPFPVS